jgi:hypothetical protein
MEPYITKIAFDSHALGYLDFFNAVAVVATILAESSCNETWFWIQQCNGDDQVGGPRFPRIGTCIHSFGCMLEA